MAPTRLRQVQGAHVAGTRCEPVGGKACGELGSWKEHASHRLGHESLGNLKGGRGLASPTRLRQEQLVDLGTHSLSIGAADVPLARLEGGEPERKVGKFGVEAQGCNVDVRVGDLEERRHLAWEHGLGQTTEKEELRQTLVGPAIKRRLRHHPELYQILTGPEMGKDMSSERGLVIEI